MVVYESYKESWTRMETWNSFDYICLEQFQSSPEDLWSRNQILISPS